MGGSASTHLLDENLKDFDESTAEYEVYPAYNYSARNIKFIQWKNVPSALKDRMKIAVLNEFKKQGFSNTELYFPVYLLHVRKNYQGKPDLSILFNQTIREVLADIQTANNITFPPYVLTSNGIGWFVHFLYNTGSSLDQGSNFLISKP